MGRAQVNRILVTLALLVLLPSIVVAERCRRGAGRRVARRGIAAVARLCGVRFVVHGEPPAGPSVVVATHSSPLDVPAVLVAVPDVRFLAAAELFRVPLLAAAMRALGTVPLARRDPERAHGQLDDLVAGWGDGTPPVAVFPEGGIAPAGTRLPFKSGAFTLAVRTGAPVVPVVLTGTATVLPPRGRLAVRPGTVTVEVLPPVPSGDRTVGDHRALRDEVHQLLTAVGPSGGTVSRGR